MYDELWSRVCELLKEDMSFISYETWILPASILSMDESNVYIKVRTVFQKTNLETKYTDLVRNAFKQATGKEYTLHFTCEEEEKRGVQTPIQAPVERNSVLNPKYTFNTFVIGKSNELAHAAALATAENPGNAYNPLFLYGGVGLGKTHLMHAIGNFVLEQNPEAKVLYITTEKFTNELIQAIQNNKTDEFRSKYRSIDVLLIDDIQFLISKERSQEEFFHTFNELYESHKQIVICSDRPPKDINPLEDRLKSRFEWGLIVDIGKPDYETRYAILRKKSQLDNINIDDQILSTIALKVESNIRELEGTLNKIIALASLTNSEITMQLAENAISDLHHSQDKVINIDYIQNVVAKYYNLSQNDFKIKRRSGDIAYPRQIAMYLCKQLTTSTLVEIGKQFGGRDHTTVLYACNRIEEEININQNTKKIVDNIKKLILD